MTPANQEADSFLAAVLALPNRPPPMNFTPEERHWFDVIGGRKPYGPPPLNFDPNETLALCATESMHIDSNGDLVGFRYQDAEGFDVTIDVVVP